MQKRCSGGNRTIRTCIRSLRLPGPGTSGRVITQRMPPPHWSRESMNNLQRRLHSTQNETAAVAFQLAPTLSLERVTARGKFLFVGDEKFWVKGVTYGTFRPD